MIVRILAFVPLLAAASIGAVWVFQTFESRLYRGEHLGYGAAVAVFIAIAVIMWMLAPWHARRSVRMPRRLECPSCRYRLEGLTEPRCPECGLFLTSEFVATPGEKTPPPRDPDRVLLRQIATTVLRLIAIVGLVCCVPYLLFAVIESVRAMSGVSVYGSSVEWEAAVFFVSLVAVFVSMLVWGSSLSAFIVPARARFEPRRAGPPAG